MAVQLCAHCAIGLDYEAELYMSGCESDAISLYNFF